MRPSFAVVADLGGGHLLEAATEASGFPYRRGASITVGGPSDVVVPGFSILGCT